MVGRKSRIVIPARLSYLYAVTAYVREVAKLLGFTGTELNAINVAAEETFVNIVKHGFAKNPGASLTLECEETGGSLELVFYAKALPFDAQNIPEFDLAALNRGGPVSGLGTYLVRELMDNVLYQNLGREGYAIRLSKTRRSPQPGVESRGGVPAGPAAASSPAEPCTVRPLLEEEAIEVSKCAYEAYGYSYEDYIYYPEKIVELNRAGVMHSVVAATKKGTLAGHAALKLSAPGVKSGELSAFFLQPEYHASDLGLHLGRTLLERAGQLGLNSVFIRTPAGDKISQQLFDALGFRSCGLLLAAFPAAPDDKPQSTVIQHRINGLLQWRTVTEPRTRRVFPPPVLRAAVESCYRGIGIPASKFDADIEAKRVVKETSLLRVSKAEVLNTAEIAVEQYGWDVMAKIRKELRLLCLEGISAVYLQLNLEHPATGEFYRQLEQTGFFYSGVLPEGLAGQDALLLQYLNNLRVNYEAIEVQGQETKELLSSVREQDPVHRDLTALEGR